MVALFGTALACLALAITALVRLQEPGAVFLLVGGLLYLVGDIGVTMGFNVPRNNALAAVDAASAEGAILWPRYVSGWTAWNTVRAVASIAAAAALTIALVAGRTS